ncbi:Ulp1 protease family, carboxy-terminal domain protein [Sesbania bispinosa]|nr:Ulp1 protease family, carboxy-terminal domain protein [Sesbania bispinosa]
MTTQLNEVEKSISKVLFCMQYAAFGNPNEDNKKSNNTPRSCPPRTQGKNLDLTDYEDLDDYGEEDHANIELDVSTEDGGVRLSSQSARRKTKRQAALKRSLARKKGVSSHGGAGKDEQKRRSQKRKTSNELKNKTPSPNHIDGNIQKSKNFYQGECSKMDDSINSPSARINPGSSDSNNSALWVLDWMAMDYTFQPNVHGVINENKVRMKTTMSLLLGTHNEVRKNLKAKAENYYQSEVQCAKY